MRLIFSLLLLVATIARAADIADPNAFARVPGVDIGVIGGIPTRTNIIDVTASPYFASGSAVETTGNITSGSNSLVVASATSFAVGQKISVGYPTIQTVTVTSSASGSGNFTIYVPWDNIYRTYPVTVSVTSGQTASQIAALLRAATYRTFTASGSGADVVLTATTLGPLVTASVASDYATASVAVTRAGTDAANTTITAITDTTFTLAANAASSCTNGIVAHNDRDAIAAAITAAGSGDVVYLPAGTYRMDSQINCSKSNFTVRGAGSLPISNPPTKIDLRRALGAAFVVYGSNDRNWAAPEGMEPVAQSGTQITAGMTLGGTSLTVGNSALFTAGQVIQLAISNQVDETYITAGSVLPYSFYGFPTLRRPMHRIEAIPDSTHLTISPPIRFTVDANLVTYAGYMQVKYNAVGFEDFLLSGIHGPMLYGINLNNTDGCWIKNVAILESFNYPIQISDSVNWEVRGCYITGQNGTGTNCAGILVNHSCNGLSEDNAIAYVFPGYEVNFGSCGNVFGYDFVLSSIGGGLLYHGPHPSHNYFEGSVLSAYHSDGYFGSASNGTVYRSWLYATNFLSNTYYVYYPMLNLNRFSRKDAVIGNILATADWPYGSQAYGFGYPSGGTPEGSPVQPTAGNYWEHFNNQVRLTTRTSDTVGEFTVMGGRTGTLPYPFTDVPMNAVKPSNTTYESWSFTATTQSGNLMPFTNASPALPALNTDMVLYFGNGAFKNIDQDAFSQLDTPAGSTYVTANYEAWSSSLQIPSNQALGGNTLADSFYGATKAALVARGVKWPSSMTFPPFNPSSPGDLTQTGWARIPAGYRFVYGVNPTMDGSSAVPSYQVGKRRLIRR